MHSRGVPVADREQYIEGHIGLVAGITKGVMSWLPDGEYEYLDLFHDGMLGLIQCLDTYNPGGEVVFVIYAAKRVRGAILDRLRRDDFLRSKQRRWLIKEEDRARQWFHTIFGREATTAEVAEVLGVDLEMYQHMMCGQPIRELFSLDERKEYRKDRDYHSDEITENLWTQPITDPAQLAEYGELRKVASMLPGRAGAIIANHYFNDEKLRDMESRYGIKESRINQIKSAGLQQLYKIYA